MVILPRLRLEDWILTAAIDVLYPSSFEEGF